MLIVGAKGFAKEVLEVLHQNNDAEGSVFYDDLSTDLPEKLFSKFPILRNIEELTAFKVENELNNFTLGIGNPKNRFKMSQKFKSMGMVLSSTISPKATIGHYDVEIGEGVNCMSGVVITNSIKIFEGCLLNLNATIGHDSVLEQYVELSPGVHISGNCHIGEFTVLGTNATVLPGVRVGKNCVIGAGAVVNVDIPDSSLAVGVPAKVIKSLL